MGNSNGGNRSSVDRELGRVDSEYNNYNSNQLGPNNDFGRGEAGRLRSEVEQGFRGGASAAGKGFKGGSSNGLLGPAGGSSYGGDVNWNDSAIGDTGSARAGYEDFARGGGVDATAMRRANTIIPSFYDAYRSSAQRRANTQGGYSPGFDAQQAELGRQAGREGFNASRQTEGDIARLTQSGRLAGLSGLMGLGGMETQNNQFNTSGRFSADEGNANRRQSAGQFDQGMGLDWARFGEGQRQYNQSGMASLLGMDQDQYNTNQDNYLRGISGRQGAAQNLIFGRTEPTSRAGQIAGGLLGAGTSLLGNYGGGRRRPQVSGMWEAGGGG